MPNEMEETNKFTSTRIADLQREFNTNPDFGFQGILKANDAALAAQQAQAQPAPQQPATEQHQGQQPADGEPTPEQVAAILEPVNNQFQQFRGDFNNLQQEIQQFRGQMGQFQPQAAAPDPNAPPPDPMVARMEAIAQQQRKLQSDNLYQKARNSLLEVSQRYPEAKLNEKDLQDLWTRSDIANNVDTFERANWGDHWEMTANTRIAPHLQSRIKHLEAEVARAKANPQQNAIDALAGVPQGRRGNLILPSQQQYVQPDGTDDRIYNDAINGMGKGQFRGFGRKLVEAQQKALVAGGV